jgi:hypothetical protein
VRDQIPFFRDDKRLLGSFHTRRLLMNGLAITAPSTNQKMRW